AGAGAGHARGPGSLLGRLGLRAQLRHADPDRAGRRGGGMTELAASRAAVTAAADPLVQLREDDPAWMDLVLTASDATVFHLPAWTRVVAGTYGYRAAVLAETDGRGRVAAGVPVVCVRRLAGRAWVSLPFTDRCAPLARDGAGLARLAVGLTRWSAGEGAPVEVRGPLPPVPGWRDA